MPTERIQPVDRISLLEADLLSRIHEDGSLPYAVSPFPVRRAKKSSLLWFNEDFRLEKEGSPNSVIGLANEFTAAFGVKAVSSDQASRARKKIQDIRYAEVFGATGGSQSGGAGAGLVCGAYYAEGIGDNLLAERGQRAELQRREISLNDAIRWAAWAKAANKLLPFGAVEVAAILENEFIGDGNFPERSIVVIRRNCIRLSHLERSIFFGTVGTRYSDQHKDAERVSELIRVFSSTISPIMRPSVAIETIFLRLADQQGALTALNFPSKLFSSDQFTISGALLDCRFRDERAHVDPYACFVHQKLVDAAASVVGYFAKYKAEYFDRDYLTALSDRIQLQLEQAYLKFGRIALDQISDQEYRWNRAGDSLELLIQETYTRILNTIKAEVQ